MNETPVQITAIIFEDVEAFLKEELKHFGVDAVAAVYPVSTFTPEWGRMYFDEEEEQSKFALLEDHVKALRTLCELVDAKKLFVGCVRNAHELTDPCNWDVEVVDAYYQIIYHGEVIYG